MSVSKKDVEHIAELARLSFTESEKEGLAVDLSNILKYVDELQSLPTQGVEGTLNPVYIENRLREDLPGEEFGVEKALMNAPERLEDYLKVPSVIGVEDAEY